MEKVKEVLFDEESIKQRVSELGAELSREYEGKNPLVIGILKGAFVFGADLVRAMTVPCEVDFMVAKSYGSSTEPGALRIVKDVDCDIAGRDVLIVEDIVDTGQTLSKLTEVLGNRGVKSLKVCCFLDKPSRRKVEFEADFVGYAIDDLFVVGYGLDYDEKYRNLPYIGCIGFCD